MRSCGGYNNYLVYTDNRLPLIGSIIHLSMHYYCNTTVEIHAKLSTSNLFCKYEDDYKDMGDSMSLVIHRIWVTKSSTYLDHYTTYYARNSYRWMNILRKVMNNQRNRKVINIKAIKKRKEGNGRWEKTDTTPICNGNPCFH